uniref:LIN2 n=1 Tax=Arundo donax TaxID=35708 RepID=A0A0A9E4C0_ARUDO
MLSSTLSMIVVQHSALRREEGLRVYWCLFHLQHGGNMIINRKKGLKNGNYWTRA